MSEEKYRAIFHNSPIGILHFDSEGIITDCNNVFVRIIGSTKNDLIGLNMYKLKDDKLIESFKETLHGRNGYYNGVYKSITAEKSTPVKIVFAPIFSADNLVTGGVGIVEDISEQKKMEDLLLENEQKLKMKIENLLSTNSKNDSFELVDIIDTDELQSLMNDFYNISNIGMAIADLSGKILVSTGWQDICTKFHRRNPESIRNCIESDTLLSNGVEPGKYKLYKCANNLWDMSTPIFLGSRHVGNLFLGQFFFDDEEPDYNLFRMQAVKYGFNIDDYLAALDKVPRWSRVKVETAMTFYSKLAYILSNKSLTNIQLAKTSNENKSLLKELQHRVKNNLLMITSLIRLEIAKEDNIHATTVLMSIKNRVASLSELYSMLNYSNEYKHISVLEYFSKISNQISASMIYNKDSVKILISGSDYIVDVVKAAPLGLILNELITNSLKYSFKQKSAGTILISIEAANDLLLITFSDDGDPFPENFNYETSKGLGLELVKILTKQLNGSSLLDIYSKTFSITIPLT